MALYRNFSSRYTVKIENYNPIFTRALDRAISNEDCIFKKNITLLNESENIYKVELELKTPRNCGTSTNLDTYFVHLLFSQEYKTNSNNGNPYLFDKFLISITYPTFWEIPQKFMLYTFDDFAKFADRLEASCKINLQLKQLEIDGEISLLERHSRTFKIIDNMFGSDYKYGGKKTYLDEYLREELKRELPSYDDKSVKKEDGSITNNPSNSEFSILDKDTINSDTIKQNDNFWKKNNIPTFIPSKAEIPEGFEDIGSTIENFKNALINPTSSFQTFFNDLDFITNEGESNFINDEVLNTPPFDESVYCALIKEMHRYSLAELKDKNEENSSIKSKFGAIAGGLLGVLARNPLAPFMGINIGSSFAKIGVNKLTKVEEILPDPNLQFLNDNYSFLSIGRSQMPKTRRVIFAPLKNDQNKIYFRIIPAIVTLDFVLPMQVFKIGLKEYYLRPIGAGIERNQTNYDSVKMHRKYYHSRVGDGITNDTGERVTIIGPDIENIDFKLYYYESDSQNLNYLYFDYIKQPGFVY